MNAAHMIGKKRNRLSRIKRRLTDKDLTAATRNQMSNRESELTRELAQIK